jgi:hypothetical protein
MDEWEADRNRGLPSRTHFGTSSEMAGAVFGYGRGHSPLAPVLQAAAKSLFFFRKHPVTNSAN